MMDVETLMRAAESGDAVTLKALLANGAPVNARTIGGGSALMLAAASGRVEALQALLDAGAEIDAMKDDGFTPLMFASFFGHADVARALLSRGANLDATDQLGLTALDWAASRGFSNVARILKEAEVARRHPAASAPLIDQPPPLDQSPPHVIDTDSTIEWPSARSIPARDSEQMIDQGVGYDAEAPASGAPALAAAAATEEPEVEETLDGETVDALQGEDAEIDQGITAPLQPTVAKTFAPTPAPELTRFKVGVDRRSTAPSLGDMAGARRVPERRLPAWLGYAALVLASALAAAAATWYATAPNSSASRGAAATAPATSASAPTPAAPVAANNAPPQLTPASNVNNANTAPVEVRGNRQASGGTAPRRGGPQSDESEALNAALNEWIAATNARDVEKQMNFYAPTLTAFYRHRNVPIRAVRAEKNRLASRASKIDISIGQPEITFSRDGRIAYMSFLKDYLISGGTTGRRGEVVQELVWLKTDDGWKIISERDVRVVR